MSLFQHLGTLLRTPRIYMRWVNPNFVLHVKH